jgi:putative DNA primase/helicase
VGKDIQTVIEKLLNITGEDDIDIDQKYRPLLEATRLSTRIIIGTNGMPRLPDNSGAVANRFLILKLTNSFLGYEERHLRATLSQELPGILNLIIEGLRRLHRQGFTKTTYQETFIRDLEELGSPIRAFVREHCDLGADKRVSTEALWKVWQQWQGDECGTQTAFGRNLKVCCPGIEKKRREGGYYYMGIGLRPTTPALCIYKPNAGETVAQAAE